MGTPRKGVMLKDDSTGSERCSDLTLPSMHVVTSGRLIVLANKGYHNKIP
jgi:hypothetical protein